MYYMLRYGILLIFIDTVATLNCYICAENNVPEFGECSTQFKYDCTNYASRFNSDIRMFCRTTRHRAENGTYTIMKECISEMDHHMKFPEKNYKLDEECDLIDINGKEVAYCLCRSPLCNQSPIAEQFMAFEEKHPELFGETVEGEDSDLTSSESSNRVRSSLAPSLSLPSLPSPQQSAAFGVSSVNQRPIIPINDPRLSGGSLQLPDRKSDSQQEQSQNVIGGKGGSVVGPVSRGQFVGVQQSESSLQSRSSSPSKHGVLMRCMQCAERENGETGVCKKEIVEECTAERAHCLTRRIALNGGKFALEKHCIMPEAVSAMLGENAVVDSCSTTDGGHTEYCICSFPLCNTHSLNIQMVQFGSSEQRESHVTSLPPPPNPQISPPAPPHVLIAALNRSVPIPVALPEPTNPSSIVVSPALNRPIPSEDKASLLEQKVSVQQPIAPPSIPEQQSIDYPIENIPELKPIVPVISHGRPTHTNSKIAINRLKCAFCNESVSEPVQDCVNSMPVECDSESVCITSQARNTDGKYTIEKRCISKEEVSSMLDKTEGCSSVAVNVNFCLCGTDLCNTPSLMQQARLQGFQDGLSEPTLNKVQQGTEPTNPVSHMPTPVILDENEETETETTHFDRKAIDTAVDRLEEEERRLEERKREWANAGSSEDLSAAGVRHDSLSLLLFTVVLIVFIPIRIY